MLSQLRMSEDQVAHGGQGGQRGKLDDLKQEILRDRELALRVIGGLKEDAPEVGLEKGGVWGV